MQQWENLWKHLPGTAAHKQRESAVMAAPDRCGFLALAATLALDVRLLHQECHVLPSDTESISRGLPLQTLVTAGVLAVVKSSLACSAGLVGALSIIGFRATIKAPEELVYLLLCVATGSALGVEHPWLALAMAGVATIFAVAKVAPLTIATCRTLFIIRS